MQLIADNIIFSLQRVGGISVVWQQLLQRAACDPDLSLRVLDYPSANLCRAELSFSPSQMVSLPCRRFERYRQPAFLADSPAVFHSSYFRILDRPGVKNITTVHDLTYHFYRTGPARWVHLAEEQHALKHSEAVICVSRHTKDDLLKAYPWLKEDAVHVVYNGVGEHFIPMPGVEKKGYLLYVGSRDVAYKRFDIALEVARQTGLHLMAIGAPASPEEEVRFNQLLGAGRYTILSGVSNEQLCRYYNEALCLLYPSDYEGFGIPVLEAQRTGCPVLAQAVSSIPEVSGPAVLLTPHSPDPMQVASEMTRQVRCLLSSQTLSPATLAESITFSKQFSWDQMYYQVKQLYSSLYEN